MEKLNCRIIGSLSTNSQSHRRTRGCSRCPTRCGEIRVRRAVSWRHRRRRCPPVSVARGHCERIEPPWTPHSTLGDLGSFSIFASTADHGSHHPERRLISGGFHENVCSLMTQLYWKAYTRSKLHQAKTHCDETSSSIFAIPPNVEHLWYRKPWALYLVEPRTPTPLQGSAEKKPMQHQFW